MFLRKNEIWERGWVESMTGYSMTEACIKSKRLKIQLQMSFKCGLLIPIKYNIHTNNSVSFLDAKIF